jgi:cysteine synthase A
VISGAVGWLTDRGESDLTAVAIAPDLGERYLDTIYQSGWAQTLTGSDVLTTKQLTAESQPA